MALPPTCSAASARAAGLSRGRLRGPSFLRLSHDLVVRLDDAIDVRERLRLLATVLPPDAAYSHLTAAHLLGAHVDPPRQAHVVLNPRRVLPQRAELVVHGRRLRPADVVGHGPCASPRARRRSWTWRSTCPQPSWSPWATRSWPPGA